jgi:hypothetical protein
VSFRAKNLVYFSCDWLVGLLGIKIFFTIFIPNFRISENPNYRRPITRTCGDFHRRGAKTGGDKGFGTGGDVNIL